MTSLRWWSDAEGGDRWQAKRRFLVSIHKRGGCWKGSVLTIDISCRFALTLCNIYSTITYDYDDAGRVKTETNSITGSGGPAATTYERYPNGSVSRIVYPEGSSIRRDYNSRGQLSATGSSTSNNNWSVQYATYHYLGDGKLDYQDYVNGVHTAFGYDPRGFLNHLTVTRNGQTYAERTYYRDDRDRISAFQKGSNSSANPMEDGRGDHYWYDPEGQLTDAYYGAVDPVNNPQGPVRSDSFAYDALGNRKGCVAEWGRV